MQFNIASYKTTERVKMILNIFVKDLSFHEDFQIYNTSCIVESAIGWPKGKLKTLI